MNEKLGVAVTVSLDVLKLQDEFLTLFPDLIPKG